MSARCFAVAATAALALAVSAARADDRDAATIAAQFFRAGRAAYDRGEYRAAALAFLEADRRLPRGAAVYNAGRAWEAAGDAEQAADAFARAVERRDLDPEDADYAHAHLPPLESRCALLDVQAPSGATVIVRGVERGVVPASIHLAPGTYAIHARRRDGSDVSRVVDLPAVGAHVRLELPDLPPPIAEKPPPPPPARSPLALYGFVGLGVAAATTGVAIYTFVRFTDARRTFENSGSHDASAHDDASRFRTLTYAFGGAAIAFAALGGALLVVDASRDSRTEVSFAFGPNGAVAELRR